MGIPTVPPIGITIVYTKELHGIFVIIVQLSLGKMIKISKFDYRLPKISKPIIVFKIDNWNTGYRLPSLVMFHTIIGLE